MKKTMYTYENMDQTGETTFFFDDKDLITAIDGNDGQYRHEYMNPLFNHFNIKVKSIEKLNQNQKKAYLNYLSDNGIEIYKKQLEATSKKSDFTKFLIPSAFGYQDVLFYVDQKIKLYPEFLEMYSRFMELGQTKHKDLTLSELRIDYAFKKDARENTLESGNSRNYLTSKGHMSDQVMVLEIIHPKKVNSNWKSFKSIKTVEDFYKYVDKAKCFKIEMFKK